MRPIRKTVQSENMQRRANQVIAHGALTNSKRPSCFVSGVYPTHIDRGMGAVIWDLDGNEMVDYICGLGSMLFGYRHVRIDKEVETQMKKGTTFSLGSALEVEVAELVSNQFSHIELVRFLKTGSEACSAAIRIARAFTGKKYVFSDGYHGWHDEFTSLTPPHTGVPPLYAKFMGKLPLDFTPSLFENDVAAVIVEPVITDNSEARIDWLHRLRHETKKNDVLLIFDETITCIRYPGLSVSKATGIDPDLSIMGKALGGGYPLALVGGREKVMSSDYFVSSTFAGDTIALAACKAVFGIINDSSTMDVLHQKANAFVTKFNELSELVQIQGYATRGVFKGHELTLALFMQECVKAGVLFGPSFFYGAQHHVCDDQVLAICKSVLTRIKNGDVRLEGPMPVKPFAQKVREQ